VRKRDIREQRRDKSTRWDAQPSPEPDEGESEGGEPDSYPLDLWPQELSEQQEAGRR
jgi:hypothetical protein